jgi:predicted tellurium resistance membrane protein TerC
MDFIIPLLSLVALEAILGIDNVVFISIVASKLPQEKQRKARTIGLILAGFLRIGLLALISVILKLQDDLFSDFGHGFTGKDLILLGGGLFLLYKSSKEIFHKAEGDLEGDMKEKKIVTFAQVIAQILILDLVFSIDSIITAVGMVEDVWIMYIAVVLTVIMMIFASEPISAFIDKHPSFKLLALSFLLMIGLSLVAEGLGTHIPKGYVYFSMAFSMFVNLLQLKLQKDHKK